VIAGDYEQEAMAFLVQNRIRNGFQCCAIRATGWGERRKEILKDLAALTGGRAITDDLGMKLENLTADYFGRAKRAMITETRTVITGGEGDEQAVAARVDEIRKQIEAAKAAQSDPDHARLLEQRLSGLTGGVAVIKVGGATEAEMREKKDRVEDAMFATKAAAESGVVPGGGMALLLAADVMRKQSDASVCAGAQIVFDACAEPMKQIAENAGKSGEAVVDKVRGYRHLVDCIGYNAATGVYEDMRKAGILDPLKVVKEEITNAVAAAMMILRSEAVIAEDFAEAK
jgi:chaperonin GroEL